MFFGGAGRKKQANIFFNPWKILREY